MAKLIRTIPCLTIITDKETNAATYIHVVEKLSLPAGGFFPPIMIGTLWERTKAGDKMTVRMRIFTPDGDEYPSNDIRVEFGNFERYRINMRLPSFPVPESGSYRIRVEHIGRKDWVKDDEFILQVAIETEPSG